MSPSDDLEASKAPEVRDEPVVKIDCKQGLLRAVRFNSDGQYAMTCGSDRTIKLWRPSKLLELKCYKGHSADVVDCQVRADNGQFVSASQDKSVIVWDVETGKLVRRFRNMAPFNTLCYGHEHSTVLAGSVDGTARIYDLRAVNAHEPIQSLSEADDAITCCRVGANRMIFTTSLDKHLRSYDLRRGKLALDNLGRPLNCVSVSHDSNTLLVGCLRGAPILVDREAGQVLCAYLGNENKLFRLESAFAMKDTMVAAGSEDGRVCLWNLASGAAPALAFRHADVAPPIVQAISCDTLDHLLTACSSHLFMWSI